MTIKEYLERFAARSVCSDEEDFNAYDYSGGNYDDAYALGKHDGKTLLAQELLEKFFTEG